MRRLIEEVFRHGLSSQDLETSHDSCELKINSGRIAFTTDSYVVRPLVFPGGDIGRLAVWGTVNDLAMVGARPRWLSAGFILEEGFPLDELGGLIRSMGEAASQAEVSLVTGDTKVVDKGKGDGVYINTAGIGVIEHDLSIHPGSIQPGDVCLLSGDIGRHGIAVLNAREGLSLQGVIESDLAQLQQPVLSLLEAGFDLCCLRDLTRGGLATALIEIAESSGRSLEVREIDVPVRDDVRGACELLGLDPLYVANEGRFVAFVPETESERALQILRGLSVSREATTIARVGYRETGSVALESAIGVSRILDMLSGEQLPRIC